MSHRQIHGPVAAELQDRPPSVLEQLAAGAALVHDEIRPPEGSSIAVFGCGPYGLDVVLAAADCGCGPIFVIDADPVQLLRACELGATHVIDPGMDDPTEAIRAVRRRGPRFTVNADLAAVPGPMAQATDDACALHAAA